MILVVKEIVWDEFNVSHIERHAVTTDEVEEICSGKVEARLGHSDRFMVIGKTAASRILIIVPAQKREGVFYPVTARDVSRKERRWIKSNE